MKFHDQYLLENFGETGMISNPFCRALLWCCADKNFCWRAVLKSSACESRAFIRHVPVEKLPYGIMSRVPPWLKILLTAYFLQREMQTHTSWCLIVKTAEKKGEKKLSWFENNNSEEHYKVKTWSNSIAKNNSVRNFSIQIHWNRQLCD